MHISHKYKVGYCAIPRTASRTTRAWLENEYGASEAGGPHSFKHHLPNDYYIFTTVRNPYKRILSKYVDKSKGRDDLPDTEQDVDAFEQWVLSLPVVERHGELLVAKQGSFRKYYNSLVNSSLLILGQVESLNLIREYWPDINIIKAENLNQSLAGLPFVDKPVNLPHQSVRNHRMFYRTEKVIDRVYRIFKKDFDQLSYDRSVELL